jgi:hypothetical protein
MTAQEIRKFLDPGRVMLKFWRGKRKKEQSVSPSEGTYVPLRMDGPDLSNVDIEDLGHMAQNVMWARENLDSMLDCIEGHRSDGHDCPPYCVPTPITNFLTQLTNEHLLILLVVLMKDLEVTFVSEP